MFYKGKENALAKKLSSVGLLFLGLGNIIGPQVFLILTGLISLTGMYGLIVMAGSMLIAFLISFVYAEISMAMPVDGVVIDSVNDAYGGFFSFLVGWSQLLGNVVFAAFCAIGMGTFVGLPFWGAAGILLLGAFLQLSGIDSIDRLEKLFVIPLVIFFATLIFYNVSLADQVPMLPVMDLTGAKSILFGIGFFFLAFTGFEDLSTYSAEIKNMRKLPMTMFGAIVLVGIIYIGLYYALMARGYTSGDPFLYLTRPLLGEHAGLAVRFFAILATVSSLMPALTSSTRNVYSMAEKGFFPRRFNVLKGGVPVLAVFAATFMAFGIVLIGSVDILAYLSNFLYFLMTIIITLAAIKLREIRQKLDRPFKMPLFPLLPFLTVIMLVVLIFFLDLTSLALGIVWMFFGFVVYLMKAVGSFRLRIAMIGGYFIVAVALTLIYLLVPVAIPALENYRYMFLVLLVLVGLLSLDLAKDVVTLSG